MSVPTGADAPGRLVAWWSRFWFHPVSTVPLALVRIAYGLVVVLWAATLLPDAAAFLSDRSLDALPRDPALLDGLLARQPSLPLAVGTVLVLIAAAAALAAGWHARLASAVVFLALLWLQRRTPYVWNSGDALLRHIGFYLLLAPSGAALSLDRWRRARADFWASPRRAPWALRLLQVQLAVIYLSTVWDKWGGATWREGTAVHYVWHLSDLARFPVPPAVASSELLVALATYGTLGIELAVALLIWNRRARPWVAAGGLAMHAVIALTLRVGFFTLAMGCLYLAFLPPETADRAVDRLRRGLRRRGSGDLPCEKPGPDHSRPALTVPTQRE